MREILEKVSKLNQELIVIEKQISVLENKRVHDFVDASHDSWPWTKHRVKVEGHMSDDGKHLNLLKERRKRRIKELNIITHKAVNYISKQSNPELREILMLRYIKGWTYEDIASCMNYANESVPRLRIKRFFKRTKIKR